MANGMAQWPMARANGQGQWALAMAMAQWRHWPWPNGHGPLAKWAMANGHGQLPMAHGGIGQSMAGIGQPMAHTHDKMGWHGTLHDRKYEIGHLHGILVCTRLMPPTL